MKKKTNPIINELKEFRNQNLKKEKKHYPPEENILDFELLSSGLSAKFSRLPPSEIDNEIENGLRLIVEFLNLNRSTIFECDLENEMFIARYSYAVKGTDRITTSFGANLFPYTWDTLRKGESFLFTSYADLPKEADIDISNYKKVALKSGYIVPIIIDRKVRFALAGGISTEINYNWPKDLLPRIQFIGEIFAHAIEKSNHVQKFNALIEINQKLISELNRFIPKEVSSLEDERINLLSNKTKAHKKDWLSEGTKYFAEYGRIDLNRICARIGLAKTSFYNKYPNLEKNKGLERYRKEILDHIYTRLNLFCSKSKQLIKKESSKNTIIELLDLACEQPSIFQCLGQIMINKTDPYIIMMAEKTNSNFEELVSKLLENITKDKNLSIVERKGTERIIITNIYHQALVLQPGQWKKQVMNSLEHIISFIK